MMRNKVAIVLGGTLPHMALIEKPKQRGYYTILVDYYKELHAKLNADEYITRKILYCYFS